MGDCGCGGSTAKRAARTERRAAQQQQAPAQKSTEGPQDRGSSYYSRSGQYTGPSK